jgi:DNA-binding Lrp family transcriptional regulator
MTGEKIFCVYHKREPDFISEPDIIKTGDYDYVATVVCEDLEDVFRITNTIDKEWWKNPEIRKLNPDKDGFRSTSVGDLVIEFGKELKAENMKCHIVCGLGFKEVKATTTDAGLQS